MKKYLFFKNSFEIIINDKEIIKPNKIIDGYILPFEMILILEVNGKNDYVIKLESEVNFLKTFP